MQLWFVTGGVRRDSWACYGIEMTERRGQRCNQVKQAVTDQHINKAILMGSFDWSMIVTSRHNLIMIATSVPPGDRQDYSTIDPDHDRDRAQPYISIRIQNDCDFHSSTKRPECRQRRNSQHDFLQRQTVTPSHHGTCFSTRHRQRPSTNSTLFVLFFLCGPCSFYLGHV